MREIDADLLIVGGGVGGVAAALAAARHGARVILTEQTDWLGGQFTSQAVPPDEHPWIESHGCTASYRRFRDAVRDQYRTSYPLTAASRRERHLNPGAAYVSALAHEPRVALSVIDSLLDPYRSVGLVQALLEHRTMEADIDADEVTSVLLRDDRSGEEMAISARFFLDATETGELLPLTGTEYVSGAESQEETGEPHASSTSDPRNMQAISVCFAIDHVNGDHTIDEPPEYQYWRSYAPHFWPGPLLGWVAPDPQTLEPVVRTLDPNPDPDPFFDARSRPFERHGDRQLWLFRRILARRHFDEGFLSSDVTLVNWPMTDFFEGPIYEVDERYAAHNLQRARALSLSMLYWMQTEAPRPDGGIGYPGLRLRSDVVGTSDGLAKAPYVRESRRIQARRTVTEQDLGRDIRGVQGAVSYEDAVGIGSYRIDLHPSTGGDNYIDIATCPFEIPLGALVPIRMRNLLPAAKNIGTTHVTNGCCRLHPIEWNVGEVAGLLATFCIGHKAIPAQVCEDARLLRDFQALLTGDGIELEWPPST